MVIAVAYAVVSVFSPTVVGLLMLITLVSLAAVSVVYFGGRWVWHGNKAN
jgi:hypothetical protein